MSRPKHYWYGIVKTQIMASEGITEHSLQSTIMAHAIEDALKETERMPNGEMRIKAIRGILFEQRATYDGLAFEMHYDWHTIQNWVTSFVNLVGKKAGY